MALPSRRNSGLLATANRICGPSARPPSMIPSRIKVSTRLPLPTGTVDLLMTTRCRMEVMAAPIPLAAISRYRRSERH